MIEVTATTKIGDLSIPIIYCEYESTDEFRETVLAAGGDPEEALKNAVNAHQGQNSMQSPKGVPREAINTHGVDSDEAQVALAEYPVNVYAFRYKGAEGSRKGDGVKQKESQAAVRHVKGAIADMDEEDVFTKAELLELLAAEGKGVSL